jgi:hypothetical protein
LKKVVIWSFSPSIWISQSILLGSLYLSKKIFVRLSQIMKILIPTFLDVIRM